MGLGGSGVPLSRARGGDARRRRLGSPPPTPSLTPTRLWSRGLGRSSDPGGPTSFSARGRVGRPDREWPGELGVWNGDVNLDLLLLLLRPLAFLPPLLVVLRGGPLLDLGSWAHPRRLPDQDLHDPVAAGRERFSVQKTRHMTHLSLDGLRGRSLVESGGRSGGPRGGHNLGGSWARRKGSGADREGCLRERGLPPS